MSLLPIFLRLEERAVLVVGAGTVALDKIESLRNTGAVITVVAPQAIPQIRDLAAADVIAWRQRAFQPTDIAGAFLVIAATNDCSVNHTVYQEALARKVLCNAVDDPPNCDFYFGSVVTRGDLQIAISTSGESPALAQRLRREIDEQLPEDLGPWLRELGGLRREIRTALPAGVARNLLLHELTQRHLCESPTCPTRQYVANRIEQLRSPEVSA